MERHKCNEELEAAKKARVVEIMALLTMTNTLFLSDRLSTTLIDVQ